MTKANGKSEAAPKNLPEMEEDDHGGESSARSPFAPALDAKQILEQLERILNSPTFRNSKRQSSFLRYIVEETLNGHADQLKERTIGVNVFGRECDYDTNADPIVRVSAGELRKRLAQYYFEAAEPGEIRIELPAGSYIPEFRPPLPSAVTPAQAAPAAIKHPAFRTIHLAFAIATAAIFVLLLWLQPWVPHAPFAQFWRPIFESNDPVLVILPGRRFFVPPPSAEDSATGGQPARPQSPQPEQTTSRQPPLWVRLEDAAAMSELAGVLHAHKKTVRLLAQSETTLPDMKSGPVILVGVFTNQLTMRLSSQARYAFTSDPETNTPWLQDRQEPNNKQWQLTRTSDQELTDYAVVSRVLDPGTGQPTIIAAGITGTGTAAAGKFISDPQAMQAVSRLAPRRWDQMNAQVVLRIHIKNRQVVSTEPIAAYFW